MPKSREDLAEELGYVRYRCRRHGTFWSDSGPCCPGCPEPDEETEETPDEERETSE